jgi:hypothetical protein
LKKPARLKAAARFFPDEESEATTAPQITSEGRINAPLHYYHFKGKKDGLTNILETDFDAYQPCIKTLEKGKGYSLSKAVRR